MFCPLLGSNGAQVVAALLLVTHIVAAAFAFSLTLGERERCFVASFSSVALHQLLVFGCEMHLGGGCWHLDETQCRIVSSRTGRVTALRVCSHRVVSHSKAKQYVRCFRSLQELAFNNAPTVRMIFTTMTGAIPSWIARIVIIAISTRMFFVRDMDNSVYQEIIMVWCFFVAAVDLFWAWAW